MLAGGPRRDRSQGWCRCFVYLIAILLLFTVVGVYIRFSDNRHHLRQHDSHLHVGNPPPSSTPHVDPLLGRVQEIEETTESHLPEVPPPPPPPKPEKKVDEFAVYLIRHGEAQHNVGRCTRDPRLTKKGVSQVRATASSAKDSLPPPSDMIVFVSPLARTIETWQEFRGAMCDAADCEFEASLEPLVQETGAGNIPCDTGRESDILVSEFPQLSELIQASELPNEWYLPSQTPEQRVTRFKHLLADHLDSGGKPVLVVAHHGVLRRLVGKAFRNAELQRCIVDTDHARIHRCVNVAG